MRDSPTATVIVKTPPPAAEERTLAVRFARGDERAFDEVVERYQARIAGLAYRLLGWPDEVEDVVQDVFLAALEGRKKFRCEATLATWLSAITIRKCRSHRRRQLLRWSWKSGRRGSDEHAASATTGDTGIVRDETAAQVRAAVDNLPGRYREVVVLRYLEEMPTAEVARVLGLSRGAVDVRLSRARKRLKKLLAGIIES